MRFDLQLNSESISSNNPCWLILDSRIITWFPFLNVPDPKHRRNRSRSHRNVNLLMNQFTIVLSSGLTDSTTRRISTNTQRYFRIKHLKHLDQTSKKTSNHLKINASILKPIRNPKWNHRSNLFNSKLFFSRVTSFFFTIGCYYTPTLMFFFVIYYLS